MLVRCLALALLIPWQASAGNEAAAPNAEMAAIFKADQDDRKVRPIDWKAVTAADKTRRERTARLLDTGALRTGDDFYDAAFVFQHGSSADDYMKAHLLAMAAMAKGQPNAPWIAAASLDRYLTATGKAQILGTQFMKADDGHFTQEPYDRTIAPDAIRKALQMPTFAEQEMERRRYEARTSGVSIRSGSFAHTRAVGLKSAVATVG